MRSISPDVHGGVPEDAAQRQLGCVGAEGRSRAFRQALESCRELLGMVGQSSEDDIISYALEESVRLTASRIGYFHFVNADQFSLALHLWSRETMARCAVGERESHYALHRAGIWADCIRLRRPVIHNDYALTPGRKGLPEGHVPVTREMAVPVFEHGLVTAVLGVGNRESEYTDFETELLQLFADIAWSVIQRRRGENRVQDSERRYRDLLRNLPQSIFYKDRDSVYLACNESYAATLGLRPDDMVGRTDMEFFPHDLAEKYHADDRRIMEQGRSEEIEEEYIVDGKRRVIHIIKSPLLDARGEITGLFGVFWDVTEFRRAEDQRDRMFDLSFDMLCVAGLDGYFRQLSPSWTRTLGWSRQELTSHPWLHFVHPDDQDATVAAGQALIDGNAIVSFENRYRCKDGSYRWMSWNSIPVPTEQLIYAVARDITESRRAHERLERQAQELRRLSRHDELTGLLNRRALLDDYIQEYERSKRYRREISVLMIDLDHFKNVNDTHGHLAGDVVLVESGRVMRTVLRNVDIIGRFGGEEFVAVLPETEAAGAMRTAERIRRAIAAHPYLVDGIVINVTCSIGVAAYDNSKLDSRDLIARADRALYRAKTEGRDRVVCWAPTLESTTIPASTPLDDILRVTC